MKCCDMRMKENKIMKMISRRDFMKASAVVGAAGVLTACGGSSSSTAASSVAASSAAASEAATGSANVGVCIYQFADNFMTLYRTDLEEYLKDMGYAVTIVDGKNDQNTQTASKKSCIPYHFLLQSHLCTGNFLCEDHDWLLLL